MPALGNDLMLEFSSVISLRNKSKADWHDVKFGDDGDKLNKFCIPLFDNPIWMSGLSYIMIVDLPDEKTMMPVQLFSNQSLMGIPSLSISATSDLAGAAPTVSNFSSAKSGAPSPVTGVVFSSIISPVTATPVLS